MSGLYPLTGQLRELAELLDTDSDEIRDAIQNTMAGIEGEFEEKADSILMVRRNIEGEVLAIDSEIARLTELKRVKKNSITAIGDYLSRNMEAANKYTIKRPLFTISLAMSPEKVIAEDVNAIPEDMVEDFISVKVDQSPDKKAIGAYLKKLREHNESVQARIDKGEDCKDELKPMPTWARLERGPRVLKIK